MRKLKVYLSGSTKHENDNFQAWRKKCMSYNNYYDVCCVDPISYFNYKSKLPQTDQQCLDLFMWQLNHCDVLLVNLDNTSISCGSCMEIEHAFCKGIPIIGFGKNEHTWYNWAETRASVIFDNLEDAMEYIISYYAESI